MQLPREPRSGDRLDWAWGQQVVRYLRSITPTGGPGVRRRQWAGGTTFEAAPGVSFRAMDPGYPFKVEDVSTETDALVSVQFGQVNSVTQTIGGVSLDNPTTPTLAVATGVVYLAVEVDEDGLVIAATIHNAAAKPANDATHGYVTLASVAVSSGVITALLPSVTHSLGYQKCSATVHNFWGL
jgi:hypothetical protein